MLPIHLGAPAAFDDGDAGSGPVHASPNLGPMRAAISAISARHLHEVSAAIPDERQFLRSWRRSLEEAVKSQHSRMIQFLLADTGTEPDTIKRANDVLAKYSRPTLNFGASTKDLALSTDTSEAAATIESELGISPAALRDLMKRTVRLYANTATALCAAEASLEEKLKRLETVVGRINELLYLEPTEALDDLRAPATAYLDSVMSKISIEEDYQNLVVSYKKFALLRGLVALGGFQRPSVPICSICITREVAQAVTPCGHTYCDECCRTQMTACYICRVQIRDRLRLYFS